MESPSYEDAAELCKQILKAYTDGEIGEIYLAYTHFKNTVSHEPKLIKLLPVEFDEDEMREAADEKVLMNYEPRVRTEPECRRWILRPAMRKI